MGHQEGEWGVMKTKIRGDVVYDPLAKMSKSMYGKESNVMVTNQNKSNSSVSK